MGGLADLPDRGWPNPIPSPTSISLHASGLGHVDACEAAAAAAEELQDPEGEDQGSVLLVGPVVAGHFGSISGCNEGRSLAEGAEFALVVESVDSDGNKSAEVGAAEASHAAACDASKRRLVGANADTNGGEEDDEHNCTHAGVNVRPARS